MTTDADILHRLYIEKLTGTLSREDEAWLNEILEKDAAARQVWAQLEREGNELQIQDFANRLEPGKELELLKASMQPGTEKKSRIAKLSWIAAAAVVLIILGAGAQWIFFSDKKITDDQLIASLIKQDKTSVRLQLAGGNEIDLQDPSQGRQVAVGTTTLKLDSNALAFNSMDTAMNLLFVPQGESYTITLSDGTAITLNADSKLRFPFKFVKETREVYLEGEAYFKVAKDAQHPFIVHTPLTKVEVLGTAFNINSYKKGTIATALLEGKVRTGAAEGETNQVLQPGQAAVYTSAKGFNIEAIDKDDVMAWTRGIYYFHDLPFEELTVAISRIYGVAISIDDKLIQKKSVSGVLDKNKLPELLDDLKSTVGIRCYYSGKTLHFYE